MPQYGTIRIRRLFIGSDSRDPVSDLLQHVSPRRSGIDDLVFELPGFLPHDICDSWIADIEAEGFEPALVNGVHGARRRPDIRDNDRLIRDDPQTAEALCKTLHPYLSKTFRKRQLVGLNERFRFYRYDVDQKFDWHQDGYFERVNGEHSLFTFMVYLNDDFEAEAHHFRMCPQASRFPIFVSRPRKGLRWCSIIRSCIAVTRSCPGVNT